VMSASNGNRSWLRIIGGSEIFEGSSLQRLSFMGENQSISSGMFDSKQTPHTNSELLNWVESFTAAEKKNKSLGTFN